MKILQRFSPASRLAFSITLIMLSILSVTSLIGLFPDKVAYRLEARARIAEALTIQFAVMASQEHAAMVQNTIAAIQQRDDNIKSIALRNHQGEIVAAASQHHELWSEAEPDKSTSTHVRVPIMNGDVPWGTLEIVFVPVNGPVWLLGISPDLLLFSLFNGIGIFIAVFILLRITLRQLDPTRSVPSRVQSAFDSLSDGIAVIDEKDNILLINQALTKIVADHDRDYLGSSLSGLLWRHWKKEDQTSELPWLTALRENRMVRDVAMNLRSGSGEIVNVLVNASPISTDGNSVNGALVTLKDVTVIERKNQDLSLAYSKLQQSESEIKKQNSQLKYLANHDPLTSCLNRRSLFEEFQKKFESNVAADRPLMCLMIDIDHFKSVNDTYGHAVGDSVIAGLAHLLRGTCRKDDLVGRYGGEEFCMVLDGIDQTGAVEFAEHLRQQVWALSSSWLQNDKKLSISIGIAPADATSGSINDAVNFADQALYEAKETGRDRAILWRPGSFENVALTAGAEERPQEVIKSPPTLSKPDPATPPSRRFAQQLALSMSACARDGSSIVVICVSIDSLEDQASALGPNVASTIVGAVEERLNSIFRDSDTISLMSGKESTARLAKGDGSRFLIELTHIDEPTSITWIMQRLAEKLSVSMQSADHHVPIRFSMGACLYPDDGVTADEIISNAVLAQKKARETGGNKAFRMYSSDMIAMDQERIQLEIGIRDALQKNEFHLHFQPIVDLSTGHVTAVEVLLRSSNQYLLNKSIEAVIQTAEMTGLIHELSNYVLQTAFSIVMEWKNEGMAVPLLSVNLSAAQLKNENIISIIIECAKKYQIDPFMVQLEMTETAMVTELDRTSNILRSLQSCGFHIALDDFGTGQSSLSHLLEINPDAIKIDKSFVQSLTTVRTNHVLVKTITELANRIGAKVVAEGVETPDQLEALSAIGCHHIQGYLVSRPLPPHIFKDWFNLFSGERCKMDASLAESEEAPAMGKASTVRK